jgi:hypothetical protein
VLDVLHAKLQPGWEPVEHPAAMQDEAATAVVAAASCRGLVIVTAALQHGLSVVATGEMCLQVLCMLT